MSEIQADETVISGGWLQEKGQAVEDESSCRIKALVRDYLIKLGEGDFGWSKLFSDPVDGRFWEHTYPQSHLHGGGPPELRCLSEEEAVARFGAWVLPKGGPASDEVGCLTGRIWRSFGVPGTGARIRIWDEKGRRVSGVSWDCTVDEAGRFTIEHLRPGMYFVQAALGDRREMTGLIPISRDERARVEINIEQATSA